MPDLLYIRDTIQIDDVLAARLAQHVLGTGSKLRLVARSVRHDAGYTLNLPGADLTIVAQDYDANGGGISVAGTSGTAGAVGAAGARHGVGSNGGAGGNGAAGGPGSLGGAIQVLCEHLHSGVFSADGGGGGLGGAGGVGGAGGAGRPAIPHKTEGTDPGFGGPGGSGGNGGAGGAGGTVLVSYVTADAQPVSTASGGLGGAGGAAGSAGPDGPELDGLAATSSSGDPVKSGSPGPSGAPGTAAAAPLTSEAYWVRAAALLGPDLGTWADIRSAAGEYFYRRDNVPADGPQTNLALAAGEFERVLRLRPTDANATVLGHQIASNQNVLGLPRTLDVTPNFPLYINSYTAWGTEVFGVFNQAINTLLAATSMDTVKEQLSLHIADIEATVTNATADHAAAVAGQKTAGQSVTFATDKVHQLTKQIQEAKKAMEDESLSLGGILTTVAEVATAVVAVIGAIPSAGASLVALVPACVSLTKTVFEDGPALVSALFGDGSVPKEVKDAYENAHQDISKLVDAGKAVVDLVDVLNKLDQAKTAANAKYTDLVKAGVEAGHALLLAQLSAEQADLQVAAAQVRIDQAKALERAAGDLMAAKTADAATTLAAGTTLIEAAALRRDALLKNAFLAERAVQIYTNKDETTAVRMDAGYIHPDVLADYAEGYLGLPEVTAQYTESWTHFLAPMTLQTDYLDYFSGQDGQLDVDYYRLTITDRRQLARFKSAHSMAFEVPLSRLPARHREAKVLSVAISFVGATSPSGVTSCEVWHGPGYSERLASGGVEVQLLAPHTDTVVAPHKKLAKAGVPAALGNPLDAPLTSPIWGRGVAGQWNLAIPKAEIALHRTNLAKLSEIDIWIVYQFRTPAT